MRKKESKVPLVVAAIVLSYIVYWGLGYARAHQPPPLQPVAQATPQPAAHPAGAVQSDLVATQSAAAPGQPGVSLMTKHAPTNPTPDPYENTEDGGSLQQNTANMQNRKLAGITDIAGKKH